MANLAMNYTSTAAMIALITLLLSRPLCRVGPTGFTVTCARLIRTRSRHDHHDEDERLLHCVLTVLAVIPRLHRAATRRDRRDARSMSSPSRAGGHAKHVNVKQSCLQSRSFSHGQACLTPSLPLSHSAVGLSSCRTRI